MPRSSSKFICQQCGYESVKWMGRCPDCGEWNSLVETVIQPPSGRAASKGGLARAGQAAPTPLSQVATIRDARRPTGSQELDRVLGGGLVLGSLVLIGGEPGIGKCLAGSTRVLDPVSGALLPITDWAETPHPILSMDEATHRMAPQVVTKFHDQGIKPVVEVKTRLGRTLRCTPSHPIFTPEGWQPIGQLPVGTRIAAPRALPFFGAEPMPEEAVKLIAYILSDGSAKSQVSVTSAIPEVEADLIGLAAHFDMTLRIYLKKNNRAKQYRFVIPYADKGYARQELAVALRKARAEKEITWAQWARDASVKQNMLIQWSCGGSVPGRAELQRLANAIGVSVTSLGSSARDRAAHITAVAHFLKAVGLRFSSAQNKAVPQPIFRLPQEQLAIFLRTLFTCDGSIYANKNGVAGISYSTISSRLAEDVQHLLLRFGFIARLRTKPMQVNDKPYTAYELQVLGVNQVKLFLREIGIWGREEAKAKIEQLASPRLSSTQFDTIPTGPVFWEHVRLLAGSVSFKEMSRQTGVTLHGSRVEGPLARTTVAAIAAAYPSLYLQNLAQGDLYWDEIRTITPAGEEKVYDLTVTESANFVANDLIVHNSTLLASVAGHVALHEGEVLYVSAEESAQQVKLRAERLGIETDKLLLLAETDVDAIVTAIEQVAPKLVVVDSIQTVASEQVVSAPGSVSQVRESTLRLMHVAKRLHIPICIIGHVTKEGTVAGPRTLEHMVDAVLYLEGERFHIYRLLRGAKNRFGPTDEVGVFEMSGDGMLDVADPSGIFLTERRGRDSGSAVVVSMEGTRPLLVEAQALATTTAFGAPRITTTGVDRNRLLMLLAVLTKRVGLALANQDVYVNVAGGFTLDEPAVDLGVAVAVASSFTERRVAPNTVLLGEIGLGGELRPVTRTLARVREAEKLGFERCILPSGGSGMESEPSAAERSKIELRRVATVREAIEIALE
jgi:DNA repair protein RadA/Sms